MNVKRVRRYVRPFLFAIALLVFAAGIAFITQSQRRFDTSETQLSELRESFPEFLANRLKKEKKDSHLLKVEIVSVQRKSNGLVDVAYSIFFDDLIGGHMMPSSVEATATLRHENEIWKVVSISTKKESVDFQD